MNIVALITDLLRSMSFFFDKLVYGFVGTVYNLLVEIAETSIFTEEVIDIFAGKIYALLGIFMLFKVSFSILTYIVNPDDFTDKNKGFSKLISNILITLGLLVLTPWLFTQAMEVQKIILRDNVIGKLFINTSNTTVLPTVADPGSLMAYQTYKAFFHVDTKSFPNCEVQMKEDGEVTFIDSTKCSSEAGISGDKFDNYANTLQYSEAANSVAIYMDDDLLNAKASDGAYFMEYIPFLSVICGVVLILLLIVFCFDIAVRSVKLGFLRMIAPIPIVSRIAPKKGKEVFDKWFKQVINTYLDLFIRLIAIYFAVFVITLVTQNLGVVDAVTGFRRSPNAFVVVFIILGALLFAKQLPKIIEDLTGVKMDGKFTLNPMKKLGDVPVVGRAAATTVGGVDSLINGQGFMSGAVRGFKSQTWSGDAKKGIFGGATETKARLASRFGSTEDAAKARKSMAERESQLKSGAELNEQKDAYVKASQAYNDLTRALNSAKEELAKATSVEARATAQKKVEDIQRQQTVAKLEAEAKMFKNKDYQKSYIDLALKKQAMYDAKNIAQSAASTLSAAETRLAQAQVSGDAAEIQKATLARESAYAALEAANSAAGKQESIFKMAEKRHDDLKVIYVKDGQTETAMDVAGKIGK